MKICFTKEFKKKKIEKKKSLMQNKTEYNLNDLPNQLAKHLGYNYLDLDTLISFSSIDKKHRNLFYEFR